MKKAILFISLITIFFISNAQDEWTLINPYPTLETFTDVHFINDNKGWVMSYNSILTTEDGGNTWETQLSSDDDFFRRLFFIDENEGWALGWEYIYHTTNAGNTWEQQNLPSHTGELNDVFFLNSDIGWIVGGYKIVMKTTDGGNTWVKIMNTYTGNIRFQSVVFFDELNGCVVGHQNEMSNAIAMATSDGGLTWVETTPPDHSGFTKIILKDSLTGWTCGYSGGLLVTNDRGNTWIDKSNIYYYSLKDICFFDDNNGVLMENYSVRLTFDGGENWDSIVPIVVSTGQRSLSNWDYNKIITVGSAGSISKSVDGGISWERVSKGLAENINQIGFFNSLDGFAITEAWTDGDLIRTNDGGYNWSYDTIIPNGSFYRMQVLGESLFLLNDSSQLMKSINEGVDWELFDIPYITSYYYDMQFVNNNIGYLCGSDGILFKTNNGGYTWTDKTLDSNYTLNSMFFINENIGWMIDEQARVVVRTINGGDDWATTFIGDFFNYQPRSIFFVNEDLGYATSTEGILFKTFDGGENWEEFSFIRGNTSTDMYFVNETEGWYRAGNSIYHTYDGGVSWISHQGFSTSLRNMFFLNDEQGWLCGDNGLIAITNFTVDINEISSNSSSISVFPNPAHDIIEVILKDKSESIVGIEVYNIQGNQVVHLENISEPNSLKIDISEFVSGTYIIHITSDKGKSLVKFIVQ